MEIDDKYRDPIDLFQETVLKGRETIYVCGYPRSGTTWLTRLLAECLNSPALSWGVKNDVRKPQHRDPAIEGLHRRGDYVVRHGHWKRKERNPGTEKIVVIHRDPRDVAVSVTHYFSAFRGQPKKAVGQMCGEKGIGLAFCNVGGRGWGGYTAAWLDSGVVQIRYEDLVTDTRTLIGKIITDVASKMPSEKDVLEAVERHTFVNRAKDKTMRKGKTGEWKQKLPTPQARKLERLCQPEMERLGYL